MCKTKSELPKWIDKRVERELNKKGFLACKFGTFVDHGSWTVEITDKFISDLHLKQLLIFDCTAGYVLDGFLFRPTSDVTEELISRLTSLFENRRPSRIGGNMIRNGRLVDFLKRSEVDLLSDETGWEILARKSELLMMRDDRSAR